MEISNYSVLFPNLTFEDFKKNLGTFTRSAVIDIASAISWDADLSFNKGDKGLLFRSYGPQIIILALTVCDEEGDPWLTRHKFLRFCKDYNSLKRPTFPDITQIISDLEKHAKEEKLYETFRDYLKPEYISKAYEFLPLALLKKEQSKPDHITPYELVSTYKILALLDQVQEISRIFEKLFRVNLLQLIRCVHALVALAPQKNGYINFRSNNTCKALIENLWDIDLKTCQLIASKISYDASNFEPLFYSEKKRYYDPLFAHAMIHLDSVQAPGSHNHLFFVSDPYYFLRGFKNWVFTQIKNNSHWPSPFNKNDQKGNEIDLSSRLGNCVEEHIGEALSYIFGPTNIQKISENNSEKSGDFYVELPTCNLLIETKVKLANNELLSSVEAYKTWVDLYSACRQCAESIKERKNPSKPVIAIILSEEHLSWDGLPFQIFALQSKMMEHMGMDGLEIMSWYSLELLLSRTSVEKFSESLVQKWDKKKSLTAADIVNLSVQPTNKPAHHYEYLKDAYDEIFQKIIPFELSNPNQPF